MRAHADPTDVPLTPDHERCAPRQMDGVYSKGLIDTIGLRYFSLLVEKKGKRIGVFSDVSFPLKSPSIFCAAMNRTPVLRLVNSW